MIQARHLELGEAGLNVGFHVCTVFEPLRAWPALKAELQEPTRTYWNSLNRSE
jgi:hypothetical protein